jgi:hypothetical protein
MISPGGLTANSAAVQLEFQDKAPQKPNHLSNLTIKFSPLEYHGK